AWPWCTPCARPPAAAPRRWWSPAIPVRSARKSPRSKTAGSRPSRSTRPCCSTWRVPAPPREKTQRDSAVTGGTGLPSPVRRAQASEIHPHEIGERTGLHLVHHPRAVDLDGALAHSQLPSDHLVRFAGDHELHHLAFARGQAPEP